MEHIKLNLTLLNILETQGIKLAYPGQNIYIKNVEEGYQINKKENHQQFNLEQEKHIKPVKVNNTAKNKK